jgi:predicted MPP superfamily phosphohydrolase
MNSAGAGSGKRVLRVAHMTDVHLTSAGNGDQWFTKALKHVQGMEDSPELIINGGDAIMCSFSSLESDAKAQWDLWRSVVGNECGVPMLHCIGNHDIWGWDRHLSQTTGNEPLWGKGLAIDALQMPDRYYSQSQAGWHFIMLDSTQHFGDPLGAALTAHIDDEQWDWLQKDLAAHTDKPTLIVTHMPITTVTSFYDGDGNRYSRTHDSYSIPGGWMHTDAAKLRDLFRKHRQVKLCLSGHMHQVDEIYFDRVGYCCSGAVCGDWWKGPYYGFDPGYALVDLYDNGTFGFQYVNYGWKPHG